MNSILVLIAAAVVGVEVGWEPLPDGGHEYTIQIEPELIDVLLQGDREIFSEVPPNIHVRRYRILVGTGKLPRFAGPASSQAKSASSARPSRAAPPKIENAPPMTEAAAPPARPAGDAGEKFTFQREPLSLPPPPQDNPAEAEQGEKVASHVDSHPSDGIVIADKPTLPDDTQRPWMAFLISAVLLCCSLSANVYLGWVAWQARQGQREALAQLRTTA